MTDSRAAHAHPPAYSVDIQGVSQHFMQGDTRIDVLKNIDLKSATEKSSQSWDRPAAANQPC